MTTCLDNQFSFDKGVFTLKTWADEQISEIVRTPNKQLTFTDTILPRLLYVAQAIACAVIGFFRTIFAFFALIWAQCKPKDMHVGLNATYATASTAVYAGAIPALLARALAPTEEWKKMTNFQTFSKDLPGLMAAAGAHFAGRV